MDSYNQEQNKLIIPDPPVRLPAIIGDIKTQKKDDDRLNIYANSTFLIGISNQVRQHYRLEKGDTIDKSLYEKLYTRREYSRLELFDRALKKGYDRNHTNSILDELERENLVSNKRYTQFFVRDKFSLNNWGPLKIKSKLLPKGIDQNLIEDVIAENITQSEMRTCCIELLNKKQKTYIREDDPYKRKQKMLRFLSGRGFPGQICYEAVESVLEKWDD